MHLGNTKILITGASFIGSHLALALIKKNPGSLRIINKTIKRKQFFKTHFPDVEFITADLRDYSAAYKYMKGFDVVFHLAADHGGRGYVNTYQGKTSTNLLLDGSVFKACLDNDIEKIFYASSGCVYPNYLQKNPKEKTYLKENDVAPPYDADNMYGWAKLMGELTLKAYYKDFQFSSAVGRFFTVYGPGASESHAVIGSIAKAFTRQDPYQIWGNGKQIRNWTYVEDIVNGIIAATEKIDNAAAVNLGTTERTSVDEMVNMVFKYMGFHPRHIQYTPMPTGPLNRVADISLSNKILKWCPKTSFKTGLQKTVEWYVKNKDRSTVRKRLEKLLIDG